MINFVVKDEKGQLVIAQIRRWVMTVTSGILIIYIIVAAGGLGWMLLWKTKENKAVSEIDTLTQQITNYKNAEVAVRQLADRAMLVDDFLKTRGDASAAAAAVLNPDFPIIEWIYNSDGIKSIQVQATSPGMLKVYEDYISGSYTKIQPAKIEWTEKQGWTGTFLLTGKKNI
jgi:hypothetical protein